MQKLEKNSIISLSNSSDPYTPMDEKHKDTRKCLKLFTKHNHKILIITKNDLVLRDIDLLKKLKTAVTFTITSLEEDISQKLEPKAPSPTKRISAIKKLEKSDIPTGLRLDPIFPELTTNEIKRIVKKASDAGVKHIVTSTFKPRKDGWDRFKKIFPKTAGKIKSLYFESGEKINNSWYLPQNIRKKIIKKVKDECDKQGVDFATCREGFTKMRTSNSCDGSHLINR